MNRKYLNTKVTSLTITSVTIRTFKNIVQITTIFLSILSNFPSIYLSVYYILRNNSIIEITKNPFASAFGNHRPIVFSSNTSIWTKQFVVHSVQCPRVSPWRVTSRSVQSVSAPSNGYQRMSTCGCVD